MFLRITSYFLNAKYFTDALICFNPHNNHILYMQKEDTEADEIIFWKIERIEPIINTMS